MTEPVVDQATIDKVDAQLREQLKAARKKVAALEAELLDAVEERDDIRILLDPTFQPPDGEKVSTLRAMFARVRARLGQPRVYMVTGPGGALYITTREPRVGRKPNFA